MNTDDIVSGLSADDLPGDLRLIADVVGVENTVKISNAFRGCSLYIRNIDTIIKGRRNSEIRKAYDKGERVIDIALKHNLSTRQIENILSGSH